MNKKTLTNRGYDVKQGSFLRLQDVQVHAGGELSHSNQLAAFGQMAHETDHKAVYVEEGQECRENVLESICNKYYKCIINIIKFKGLFD